ncbi:DUF4272 domain-containing protein [Rossellomorea aquimaris]|uniref:DUF4272 domain-containing protein n=1 Tax=Rossellomorea TaxID=2837508 RepID=UPI001CA41650|nr:DUF4272 domain-containing protein [Rossellomorea vietnamensis]
MKNVEEIATRAIILLCLSDRCALERTTIGGRVYTLKQRDEQRKAIYKWLQDKGYNSSMTLDEKMLFEQEVGKGNKDEVLSKQIQYEAIEPCLWSLGLVDKLSEYDRLVSDDFHPLLEIGGKHSLEKLLSKCRLRAFEDIVLQNEISMLWHWRAREANNSIFNIKTAKEIIISTFGDQYVQVIDCMQAFKNHQEDFIVNNKAFNDLSSEEMNLIKFIANWRHYSFEWIVGDKAWDEVELNT